MADKVQEVAKEEAYRLKSLTVEAARSAAYLYPLRVRSSLSGRPLSNPARHHRTQGLIHS